MTQVTPTPTLNPNHLGPIPAIMSATYGATRGSGFQQHDLPWLDIAADLTEHVESDIKAGDCFIPATFTPSNGAIIRRQEHFRAMHFLQFDFDKGSALQGVRDRVVRSGLAATITTTHSHMTTATEVALSALENWRAANPEGTAAQFLISRGKHHSEIVEDAEYVETVDRGKEGEPELMARFTHKPCPKLRVIIPLSKPWTAPEGSTPKQAAAAFEMLYANAVRALGFEGECDLAVDGTQSLVYQARHAKGRPFHSEVLTGAALDPYAFVAPLPHPATPAKAKAATPATKPTTGGFLGALGKSAHVVAVDPKTGEVIDLTIKAGEGLKKRFLLIQAMQAYCPDRVLSERDDVTTDAAAKTQRWCIECPNSDMHSGDTGPTSTLAWDAGANNGFGFDCKHTCQGSDNKDDLVYLKLLIEAGAIPVEALTDDRFLLPLPPKPVKPSKLLLGGDMFRLIHEKPPELVEGLIGVGTITVISGPQQTGKSALVSTVCHALLTDRPWMTRKTRKALVCVLVGEGSYRTVKDFMANCIHHGDDPATVANQGFAVHDGALMLNTEDGLTAVLARLDEFKEKFGAHPTVLFVDTARKNMRGSVSDDKDVALLYEALAVIQGHAPGISIVVIAHMAKGASDSTKGSSDWEQGADYVAHISGLVRDLKSEVKFEKNKNGKDGDKITLNYAMVDVPGAPDASPVPFLLSEKLFDAQPAERAAVPSTAAATGTKAAATKQVYINAAKAILDAHTGAPIKAADLADLVLARELTEVDPEKSPETYKKVKKDVQQWIGRGFAKGELDVYVADWTRAREASMFRNPPPGAGIVPKPPRRCAKKAHRQSTPLPMATHAAPEQMQ